MPIHVIKHIRKAYGCRDCKLAPVTADKPTQVLKTSMAIPSLPAMLLTTKHVGGLPFNRFDKVPARQGFDSPR